MTQFAASIFFFGALLFALATLMLTLAGERRAIGAALRGAVGVKTPMRGAIRLARIPFRFRRVAPLRMRAAA